MVIVTVKSKPDGRPKISTDRDDRFFLACMFLHDRFKSATKLKEE